MPSFDTRPIHEGARRMPFRKGGHWAPYNADADFLLQKTGGAYDGDLQEFVDFTGGAKRTASGKMQHRRLGSVFEERVVRRQPIDTATYVTFMGLENEPKYQEVLPLIYDDVDMLQGEVVNEAIYPTFFPDFLAEYTNARFIRSKHYSYGSKPFRMSLAIHTGIEKLGTPEGAEEWQHKSICLASNMRTGIELICLSALLSARNEYREQQFIFGRGAETMDALKVRASRGGSGEFNLKSNGLFAVLQRPNAFQAAVSYIHAMKDGHEFDTLIMDHSVLHHLAHTYTNIGYENRGEQANRNREGGISLTKEKLKSKFKNLILESRREIENLEAGQDMCMLNSTVRWSRYYLETNDRWFEAQTGTRPDEIPRINRNLYYYDYELTNLRCQNYNELVDALAIFQQDGTSNSDLDVELFRDIIASLPRLKRACEVRCTFGADFKPDPFIWWDDDARTYRPVTMIGNQDTYHSAPYTTKTIAKYAKIAAKNSGLLPTDDVNERYVKFLIDLYGITPQNNLFFAMQDSGTSTNDFAESFRDSINAPTTAADVEIANDADGLVNALERRFKADYKIDDLQAEKTALYNFATSLQQAINNNTTYGSDERRELFFAATEMIMSMERNKENFAAQNPAEIFVEVQEVVEAMKSEGSSAIPKSSFPRRAATGADYTSVLPTGFRTYEKLIDAVRKARGKDIASNVKGEGFFVPNEFFNARLDEMSELEKDDSQLVAAYVLFLTTVLNKKMLRNLNANNLPSPVGMLILDLLIDFTMKGFLFVKSSADATKQSFKVGLQTPSLSVDNNMHIVKFQYDMWCKVLVDPRRVFHVPHGSFVAYHGGACGTLAKTYATKDDGMYGSSSGGKNHWDVEIPLEGARRFVFHVGADTTQSDLGPVFSLAGSNNCPDKLVYAGMSVDRAVLSEDGDQLTWPSAFSFEFITNFSYINKGNSSYIPETIFEMWQESAQNPNGRYSNFVCAANHWIYNTATRKKEEYQSGTGVIGKLNYETCAGVFRGTDIILSGSYDTGR